jgi:hypothetical protein
MSCRLLHLVPRSWLIKETGGCDRPSFWIWFTIANMRYPIWNVVVTNTISFNAYRNTFVISFKHMSNNMSLISIDVLSTCRMTCSSLSTLPVSIRIVAIMFVCSAVYVLRFADIPNCKVANICEHYKMVMQIFLILVTITDVVNVKANLSIIVHSYGTLTWKPQSITDCL